MILFLSPLNISIQPKVNALTAMVIWPLILKAAVFVQLGQVFIGIRPHRLLRKLTE